MAEYFGYDVVLKMNSVAVAAVRDITGPGIKMDLVEVTTRDSSKWRRRIAGLKDGGTVTFEIVYDPDAATHANASGGVPYHIIQGTSNTFAVEFPTAATAVGLSFTAFVTSFTPKAPLEGAMLADLELTITSAVTIS